ncbi:linear amide C-N hydrolase [Natrarchaeobius halalkaliphilus]|uniref:Linear amide C-N hydrolase n=1 Tax=Natrarchaeobius halalkaliphilus TaxID=1679091 RepID=A0A3N6M2U7_9EURY|nr:linear amide C-N hydrolase [Natrarchaeobius halalkaliphilus]RQG90150.1 linear amide C-N hydrolase [Natrarchaeobius halalkaliphilus]
MCTRLVYLGPENRVLTARSMDWKEDIGTNIWVLPRGVERDGEVDSNSMTWTSEYGSVIATAYDIATTDGMNEAGLAANLLWLSESEYPERGGETPAMSISLWTQYMLDRFATVAEVVAHIRREDVTVVTEQVPGDDRLATVHLSLSDATGDSAILEYIDGELVVHHDRDFQVMTNSPTFDKQLALAEYWEEIGGTVMLPGTNRPADRFARASFYVDAIPQVEDRRTATAGVFGVIRNVSVPHGITTPDAPHISSTRWRSVADHKDRIYYFESALAPNAFWVELDELDFSVGSETRALDLGPDQSTVYAGDVSDQLQITDPFSFLGAATG